MVVCSLAFMIVRQVFRSGRPGPVTGRQGRGDRSDTLPIAGPERATTENPNQPTAGLTPGTDGDRLTAYPGPERWPMVSHRPDLPKAPAPARRPPDRYGRGPGGGASLLRPTGEGGPSAVLDNRSCDNRHDRTLQVSRRIVFRGALTRLRRDQLHPVLDERVEEIGRWGGVCDEVVGAPKRGHLSEEPAIELGRVRQDRHARCSRDHFLHHRRLGEVARRVPGDRRNCTDPDQCQIAADVQLASAGRPEADGADGG